MSSPSTERSNCIPYVDSAADIYIKEFLHRWLEEGNDAARPLRVYYRHRWIQTVSTTVLQYCIQEQSGPLAGTFRYSFTIDLGNAYKPLSLSLKSEKCHSSKKMNVS